MTGTTRRPLSLRARHLVTMCGAPLDGGWITIDRGRVAAIGRGPPPRGTTDLGDALILPGLVNAHTHLEFSDLDAPLSGTGGLPAWIERVVVLRRGRAHDRGSAGPSPSPLPVGMAESAAAGVTALGEISSGRTAEACGLAGPRLRVFREALGLTPGAGAAAAAACERDVARLVAAGTCAGVSPHAPYSVPTALGRCVLAVARRLRIPAAMHLAESPAEAELVRHGSGPLRTLLESLEAWPSAPPRLLPAEAWIPLLARLPRALVVHGTFLEDAGLLQLARHRDRVAVVVCPRTTRHLSGVLPPLGRFRDAGVRVALGTDSRASNDDLSVLGECRALVGAGLAAPAAALRMATVDGAWALGFERRAGILAAGRPADVVVLRPTRVTDDPCNAALDPAAAIVATLRRGRPIFMRSPDALRS